MSSTGTITGNTVVHDFNGPEINGIHGLYEKKGCDEALYSVNKRHDITRIHDINGNFPYDDIFRKNHARLYYYRSQLNCIETRRDYQNVTPLTFLPDEILMLIINYLDLKFDRKA